ncbi:unnamed protein product [Rotaria magnacalcarata]|uniref:Uncharacterized protein n=1 Tax=Rotaria magnacalcarata TaxID=392030 RepID=A0A814QP48_9BILA|nr:unnamed protein product [Rotaria magnacalcarata]CAF1549206.1 unnamed protein product [Rotaria magnacalcarata]CAF2214719.1 unnamed protein product [Rotaria magnacalcarata]CAF3774515.1 unnamed protein product [Rotaria magnacalcarata]CAF4128921.1 unnamed protein product [Rotaria magnacalcarata]
MFSIFMLTGFGVITIIVLFGLILAQIFIKRADKTQIHTDIIYEQSQDITIDIDELPAVKQGPDISVTSNDIIEGISHRHNHANKRTAPFIDQDSQIYYINAKKTPSESFFTTKSLTIPIKTNTDRISSDTSLVNPLTNKITLEY